MSLTYSAVEIEIILSNRSNALRDKPKKTSQPTVFTKEQNAIYTKPLEMTYYIFFLIVRKNCSTNKIQATSFGTRVLFCFIISAIARDNVTKNED